MNMPKFFVSLSIALPIFAGDIMVERMQSVVDEVSELRQRYEASVQKNEACLAQVNEQNKLLSKKGLSPSADKQKLQALETENAKLKKAFEAAKEQNRRISGLESELESLEKEKQRLNVSAQILVEKNHALLDQVNKLKRSDIKTDPNKILVLSKDKEALEKKLALSEEKVKNLEAKINVNQTASSANVLVLEENKRLSKALENCKSASKTYVKTINTSSKVCVDDNPFPKLLKKETKSHNKIKPEKTQVLKKKQKSGVYRVRGESAIYDEPNGQTIEIWEDTRSFTSNIAKDKWIKVTGFFVDRKWRKAKIDMWIKKENTSER